MSIHSTLIKCIAIGLFLSTPIWGQTESRPISSPQLQWIGARPQALGGTVPTLYNDSSAIMINPASLGANDVMPFSASSQRIIGEFDYLLVNAGYQFEAPFSFQGRLKQNIAIGLSYGTMTSKQIPRTYLEDFGVIRSIGTFSGGFDMLYLSGATDIYDIAGFNILTVGVGTKLFRQTLDSQSRSSIGLDIGTLASYYFNEGWIEKLHLGVSFQNFIATVLQWDLTDSVTGEKVTDVAFLPAHFVVGIRADMLDDQLSLFAQNSITGISIGTEYWLNKNITLRGSTSFDTLSLGTGLAFDNIAGGIGDQDYGLRLDMSYTQNNFPLELDPNINFSVSLLGESKPKTPQILTPLKEITTQEKTIKLAGIGPKNTSIKIFNNRSLTRSIRSDRYGNWQFPEFKLKEGKNLIYVSAYSIEQQNASNSDPIMITSDSEPPSLNIKIYPENKNLIVSIESIEALDTVTGNIEQYPLLFKKNGALWVATTPLPKDLQSKAPLPNKFKTVSISAKDKAGNKSEAEKREVFVAVDYPYDKVVHYKDQIRFIGKIGKDTRGIQINGKSAYIDKNNNFAMETALKPGKNLVQVTVKPIAGEDLNYTTRILRLITFPDVTRSVRERREIEFLATLGILEGDADGNFYPNRQVTRRYIARTIVKLKKIAIEANTTPIFSDVTSADPDAGYIQAAIENGIVFAYPDGTFKPDQPLTMSEALFLLNNAGIIDETQSGNTQFISRKELAQYIAYTPKYELQIERLIDWEKGY